ncbi:pyridoxal kinase [Aspergillus sclerotialis]|uniref:Pyridoxal kinase n=1 Tax=Aspergillus sclerotialis TaxID=2070753 RepID=A0A3A2Z3I3_9EURO|nr:pyridoxal kinase [Aspergillus sclerotialis]
MFAALTVARLREAVFNTPGLRDTKSWVSADDVKPTELPLAKATVKVLASMHSILEKTLEGRAAELAALGEEGLDGVSGEEREKAMHLRRTKAAEIRLVRNVRFLREPVVEFEVMEWDDGDLPEEIR